MGKFYELFHNDAVIAVKELGLVYMKVRTSAAAISVDLQIDLCIHYIVLNCGAIGYKVLSLYVSFLTTKFLCDLTTIAFIGMMSRLILALSLT